jgi:hypothetical protein
MRIATCSCEQLKVTCTGEPVRISMCHCLACQRRTGSVFGVQARFPSDNVQIEGRAVSARPSPSDVAQGVCGEWRA